jgi:hypothetical protein
MTMNKQWKVLLRRMPVLTAALLPLLGSLLAGPAQAQDPQTFYACYVPEVGAVYLIKIAGLPDNCLSGSHVEFSWSEGIGEIADGSVTTAKLDDGAVTSAKLAANAVSSANVVDNSLTAGDLAAGSVGSSELAANSVTTAEIAAGAVATSDLADGAVTGAKLASLSDLEISSAASSTSLSVANTSSTGRSRLDLVDASGQQFAHIVVTNASPSTMIIANNRTGAKVQLRTAGLTRMTVANDGNIGIGTSVPSRILTVQQGSTTDPIADAWTVYSSRRWKTNIEPIEGALDKVQLLRGVSFAWTANGQRDIGLIAEEVGEVIPEVVAYDVNSEDATSVDYGRLVAVLIEAVKEQQEEIDELKALVRMLASETEVAGHKQ